MPQVSRGTRVILALLQPLAQIGQTGLQAGRAGGKDDLDLGFPDAEPVWVTDSRREQAQPFVDRQGRVDARGADVGQWTGKGCGLVRAVSSFSVVFAEVGYLCGTSPAC